MPASDTPSAPSVPPTPEPAPDLKLNRLIDHTLLSPLATAADIDALCAEARRYDFFAVCVNSAWVPRAAAALQASTTCVAAVAGFPLGAQLSAAKAD